jgi:hypothetical protein
MHSILSFYCGSLFGFVAGLVWCAITLRAHSSARR